MRGFQGSAIPSLPASPHSLHQSLATFDAKAEAWEDYTATPLGRLRQKLTLGYLAQHLESLSRNLKVLLDR